MKARWLFTALAFLGLARLAPDCRAASLAFQREDVTIPDGVGIRSYAMAIDFDSDGSLDLVITRLVSPPTDPPTYVPVHALRNLGHGQFTNATASVLGTVQTVLARDLRTADFDGDGRTDLFMGESGNDAPPFPGGQSLLLTQTADGKLRNDTSSRLPQLLTFTHHATVGDVNGDLNPDIYLANIYNEGLVGPLVYINDGHGNFTSQSNALPPEIVGLSVRYTSCLLVDVSKRGVLDLVLGGHNAAPYALTETSDRLLLNDGHGSFAYAPLNTLPPRHGGTNWETINIASADFDGDGWPDLLMSEELNYQEPFIQLLLNNQDGTFRDASSNIPQSWPAPPSGNNWFPFLRVVDLDGDGSPDFVCTHQYGPPQIFLNDGTGTFTSANELFPSGTPSNVIDIVPGDFDGDGNPDLFVLSGYGQAALLRNLLPPRVGAYSSTKTNQAIVFPRIGRRNAANGPVTLNATASSGLTVSYEVLSGPATVSSNLVTFTRPGSITLWATQSGNASFNPAVPVEQTFIVITAPFLSAYGVVSNQFGFNITGESNQIVVLEASTNLSNWSSLATNTLDASPLYFIDPAWQTFQGRFYRARLQ
jgi:hypothetical protein